MPNTEASEQGSGSSGPYISSGASDSQNSSEGQSTSDLSDGSGSPDSQSTSGSQSSGASATFDDIKPTEDGYMDVTKFGAVGDAHFSHSMGIPADDGITYYVGYYSKEPVLTPLKNYSSDTIYIADNKSSSPAHDDSEAFYAAILRSDGKLYLPEGDYLVSPDVAGLITDIKGPGRIRLSEWWGGTTYYFYAETAPLVDYQFTGWVDEAHFHDEAWMDMHWKYPLPAIEDAWPDFTPTSSHSFDEERNTANIWMVVLPLAEKSMYPEEITLCFSLETGAYYCLADDGLWYKSSEEEMGGGIFSTYWDGNFWDLDESRFQVVGDHVEYTVTRDELFAFTSGKGNNRTCLHLWSNDNDALYGKAVEYNLSYANVWVKDPRCADLLTIDVGGDLRKKVENYYESKAERIRELFDSGRKKIGDVMHKTEVFAYNIPDDKYDLYISGFRKYLSEKEEAGLL